MTRAPITDADFESFDPISGVEYDNPGDFVIHTPADFEGMRKAGRFAAEVLDFITPHVVPGVTTGELDAKIEGYINDHGVKSATIGYKGWQHASCISVNHVVCHGIRGDKALINGDILNIDVTVIKDAYHGDTSRMYYVGEPGIQARRLCETTYESMW